MDSLESDWLKDSDSLEDSLLWLDESLLEDELLDDELLEEELDEDEEDDDEADEDEDSELEDDESLEEDELLDELSQQRQFPWVGPNQRIRDPPGLGGTSPGSPRTDRSP